MSVIESLRPPGRIHGDQHKRGLALRCFRKTFVNIGGENRFPLRDSSFQFKDQRRILRLGSCGTQQSDAGDKECQAKGC